MKRILILAPHGDDEVLGCGGTITKHIESSDLVTVAFIRNAYDKRSEIQLENSKNSTAVLGVHKTIFLNLPYEDIKDVYKLVPILENLIKETRPDTLYSTFYGDLHQDHRYLFEGLNSATRFHSDHRIDNIFLYNTLSSTDQGLYKYIYPFIPNYYVPLKEYHIKKKIAALKCYTGEIKDHRHPRSETGIIEQAKSIGREIREEYAEAFYAIRQISL